MVAPLLALLVAMAAASALILNEQRGLTFFRDEWIFLLYRDGHDLENLVSSHAGHLVIWPATFYAGMFRAVGPDSYVWWRLAALGLHLAVAALLYAVARPRLGPVAALAPAVVILFLGSAWMDLLWPFQMGFTGAIAAGLVAIIAVNRGALRGDVVACLALLVAIGWSGVAVPFIAGVAVGLLIGRRFWARCWVVLLPAVLLGIWVVTLGQQHVDYGANLPHVPGYLLHLATAGVSGISGVPEGIATAILVVLAAATAWRLFQLRDTSPLAWEGAVMVVAFLLLTAVSRAQYADPTANRYVYVTVALLLVLLIGLAPSRPFSLPYALALVLLACVTIPVNLDDLRAGGRDLRLTSDVAKAELGAVEISRRTVAADYSPPLRAFYGVPAGAYLAAIDRYASSPAESPDQIAAANEHARERADAVLRAALPVRLAPAAPDLPGTAGRTCIRRRSGSHFRVPPEGVEILAAGGAPIHLGIRRFASRYAELGAVPPGEGRYLRPPGDLAPRISWWGRVTGKGAKPCLRKGGA
jgi:hypothetical protein